MKRIKAVLIGCGSVSQRGILPHLHQDDARQVIDLVALCDVVQERAQTTAAQFGVANWYIDYEQLLAEEDCDMILIATPATYHYPIAIAAAEAGKHLHIQKPMTTSLSEANALLEAVRRKGVKLVASPGQMLGRGAQQMKQFIQDGALGRVYWAFATTAFRGHEYESFRSQNPVDPAWYYKPGGGPVYDMSAYSLHTLTGILGPAKKVTAMSGIGLPVRHFQGREIKVEMDDNTLLLLDFGGNCFAMVGGHFAERGQIVGWGFMGIYGSEGAFEVTGMAGNTAYPGHVEVNPPALAGTLKLSGKPNLDQAAPFLDEHHAEIQESHLWVDIRHLVDCILNDAEPIPSGEHARHVTEIIEKGYLAARSGQTQELLTTF